MSHKKPYWPNQVRKLLVNVSEDIEDQYQFIETKFNTLDAKLGDLQRNLIIKIDNVNFQRNTLKQQLNTVESSLILIGKKLEDKIKFNVLEVQNSELKEKINKMQLTIEHKIELIQTQLGTKLQDLLINNIRDSLKPIHHILRELQKHQIELVDTKSSHDTNLYETMEAKIDLLVSKQHLNQTLRALTEIHIKQLELCRKLNQAMSNIIMITATITALKNDTIQSQMIPQKQVTANTRKSTKQGCYSNWNDNVLSQTFVFPEEMANILQKIETRFNLAEAMKLNLPKLIQFDVIKVNRLARFPAKNECYAVIVNEKVVDWSKIFHSITHVATFKNAVLMFNSSVQCSLDAKWQAMTYKHFEYQYKLYWIEENSE